MAPHKWKMTTQSEHMTCRVKYGPDSMTVFNTDVRSYHLVRPTGTKGFMQNMTLGHSKYLGGKRKTVQKTASYESSEHNRAQHGIRIVPIKLQNFFKSLMIGRTIPTFISRENTHLGINRYGSQSLQSIYLKNVHLKAETFQIHRPKFDGDLLFCCAMRNSVPNIFHDSRETLIRLNVNSGFQHFISILRNFTLFPQNTRQQLYRSVDMIARPISFSRTIGRPTRNKRSTNRKLPARQPNLVRTFSVSLLPASSALLCISNINKVEYEAVLPAEGLEIVKYLGMTNTSSQVPTEQLLQNINVTFNDQYQILTVSPSSCIFDLAPACSPLVGSEICNNEGTSSLPDYSVRNFEGEIITEGVDDESHSSTLIVEETKEEETSSLLSLNGNINIDQSALKQLSRPTTKLFRRAFNQHYGHSLVFSVSDTVCYYPCQELIVNPKKVKSKKNVTFSLPPRAQKSCGTIPREYDNVQEAYTSLNASENRSKTRKRKQGKSKQINELAPPSGRNEHLDSAKRKHPQERAVKSRSLYENCSRLLPREKKRVSSKLISESKNSGQKKKSSSSSALHNPYKSEGHTALLRTSAMLPKKPALHLIPDGHLKKNKKCRRLKSADLDSKPTRRIVIQPLLSFTTPDKQSIKKCKPKKPHAFAAAKDSLATVRRLEATTLQDRSRPRLLRERAQTFAIAPDHRKFADKTSKLVNSSLFKLPKNIISGTEKKKSQKNSETRKKDRQKSTTNSRRQSEQRTAHVSETEIRNKPKRLISRDAGKGSHKETNVRKKINKPSPPDVKIKPPKLRKKVAEPGTRKTLVVKERALLVTHWR